MHTYIMNWYIAYTKPRWEKKVELRLQQMGFITFLPLQNVVKRYTDRTINKQEILLKGYIFIKLLPEQIALAKFANGLLNFVHFEKKAAIISIKEIEALQLYVHNADSEHIEITKLEVGNTIALQSIGFKNMQGKIVKKFKNKIEIYIEQLKYKITITLRTNE
jgi:transcriptional antiterminator RfaH